MSVVAAARAAPGFRAQRRAPAAKIAVIGSCVTREVYAGVSYPGLLYLTRTSLPSLVAPRVAGFTRPQAPLPGLEPWQSIVLSVDLLKSGLPQLLSYRPDVVLLDFVDERLALVEIGAAIVSSSEELRRSGLLDRPAFAAARRIPRRSAERRELWSAAVRRLARIFAHNLPDTRIVLHRVRCATRMRTADGTVRPYGPFALRRAGIFDDLLEDYGREFLAAFPKADVVNAPEAHRISDALHRWGHNSVHYVPSYYPALERELRAALARPLSGPPYRSAD